MNQPEANPAHIIAIATAMDLEAEPFLALLESPLTTKVANQSWTSGTINDVPVVIVVTGIGLANAAAAAARTHMLFDNALAAYICAGTCGGLGADIKVGQVIVGDDFLYSRADATAFGYAPGQVPGSPATFPADSRLVEAFSAAPGGAPIAAGADIASATDTELRVGQVASSDAFVTSATVESTRELFPLALGADMESTAAAQVCSQLQVPFVSVRGVSDLCGPRAGEDFHIDAADAAARSAEVVCTRLTGALAALSS
ncbi:MAG: 5'-methylthioadenosine/S-adenosylhomocysteine nucleosidase [Actinomycetaceae bacterium]|nr:5'-methylthioadenosine/S-adenosylhomocysteine nucleosidase [Actinomycetaceae bacterium]